MMHPRDEDMQMFRAMIMPDVEKMIQQSIRKAKKQIRAEISLQKMKKLEMENIDDEGQRNRQFQILSRDIQSIRNQFKVVRDYKSQAQEIKHELKAIKKTIRQIQQSIKTLQLDLKDSKELQNDKIEKLMREMEFLKIKVAPQNIQEIKVGKKKYVEIQKQQKNISKKKVEEETKSMFDPKSENLWRYKIEGRKVQFITGDSFWWYQLLGNIPIRDKATNQFTIISTKRGQIDIGIVDRKYFKDRNSQSQKRKQCICYSLGKIWESGQQKLSGLNKIKKNDKIVMTVKNQTITWMINEKKFSIKSKIINENWVVVIMMGDNGDMVEWI